MTLISSLAMISGVMMALSNIPQAYRIFRRKSAKDISILTYSLLTIGSLVWILYGIESADWPIIASNTVGILVLFFVIGGWIRYH